MEFGLLCWKIDDVDFIGDAESLGYDYCWAPDSPMLLSNPWAALALVAQKTRRMRIGTGVAVPGLRTAPDTANGIATINRLAPGRTFLGIGTGNTAMRTLGRKPMRVRPFREYIQVVRGLLNGEEVDYGEAGLSHPIRFQNPAEGYYEIGSQIPIHVGGFGPRAQALAGELGDGLITGIPRGGTVTDALANVRAGAEQAGRELCDFFTSALVNLVLLEPGETLRSERVVARCGSSIMANVHYLVDLAKETGGEPPEYIKPIWDEYLAFHATRDAQRRHQKLHASHYSYLESEEARFVTPELIRAFCIVGQPDEIIEQLLSLEREGLDGISFIPPVDERHSMHEAFAKQVIARMR